MSSRRFHLVLKIESEKLLKQNEFLENELEKNEADLIAILMENDNTEFAQENVKFVTAVGCASVVVSDLSRTFISIATS
jgi:hypothetical protein